MREYNMKSLFLLDIEDEIIKKKNLVKKEKNSCKLFKYERNVIIDNIEEILECRGIILKDNTFICLPPCKNLENKVFFDEYNLNECKQEEFIDGTMINIYWNNDTINYSTRSQIDADDKNYGILIRPFWNLWVKRLRRIKRLRVIIC